MTVRWREMEPDDRAFVVSTWASSFRDEYSAGILHNSEWHQTIRETIGRILDEGGFRTVVVYDPAASRETELLGFICGRDGYVAYCYVKQGARRLGIARWLLELLGVDPKSRFEYGCRTRAAVELVEAGKVPAARWNPIPLRTFERKRSPHGETE